MTPLSCVKCLKNVYVYSVALKMELECFCKHSHSTTSQCHNYRKQYVTLNHCRKLEVHVLVPDYLQVPLESLEQDMWLAEAIYFPHRILFPVEIHGYSCTLHICF